MSNNFTGRGWGSSVATAALVLIVATLAIGRKVDAAPLGNPLAAVVDSSPLSSYAAPGPGFGLLTGADGDVGNPNWLSVTDSSYAHIMDAANPTPLVSIFTGLSGQTGIAITGYDGNDFLVGISAGTNIYEGTLSLSSGWTQNNIISLTTSDLTDVDYALGSYFIGTENDGVRRVEEDGSTSQLYSQAWQSVDLNEFKPNTYNNPTLQLAQNSNSQRNADMQGVPFGSPKPQFLDNTFDIQGIAYFEGGFATVQGLQADIHAPQPYQEHIESIPEPATITLLGIGGLGLLLKGHKKQGNGIYIQENSNE